MYDDILWLLDTQSPVPVLVLYSTHWNLFPVYLCAGSKSQFPLLPSFLPSLDWCVFFLSLSSGLIDESSFS